jgi:beta-glucanase (GH16 family)
MGQKKIMGLIVGVVTAALVAVGTRARAIKTSSTGIDPESSQKASQKQVMGQKTPPKKQSTKPKITSKPAPTSAQVISPTTLWSENFSTYSSSVPNAAYWNIANASQPIYNDEQQKYDPSPSNVRVEGGNLVLEARNGANGITSGMINTKGKVKISQGSRLEARIKLPKGRGVWPAFWLLSDNQPFTTALNPTDADWNSDRFYMHDGEIDIMESYGTYPGVVESTVHTFAQSYERQLSLQDEGFHTYWMEWSSDKLVFGVDGIVVSTYASDSSPLKWPYTSSNQMYVILNVAMGGSGGGQIIPAATDDLKMLVSNITYSKL